MKLKIIIEQLGGNLDIELKQNGSRWHLIVIASVSPFWSKTGNVWNGTTDDIQKISELSALVKQCHEQPFQSKRITINDGVMTKIMFDDGNTTIQLLLKDIEQGTTESLLLQKVFQLARETVPKVDVILENFYLP